MDTRVPIEDAASLDDIEDAIGAMSDADLGRAERYAAYLVEHLGAAARGRTWEDLLQEGLSRAWFGDRRWNPQKVDFLGFLRGVIKSTANSWYQKEKRSKGKEILCDHQSTDVQENPLLKAASPSTGPEDRMIALNLLEHIESEFENDPEVREVIAGLEIEMTGPEIVETTGMTNNEYQAAMKRLRRRTKHIRTKMEVS